MLKIFSQLSPAVLAVSIYNSTLYVCMSVCVFVCWLYGLCDLYVCLVYIAFFPLMFLSWITKITFVFLPVKSLLQMSLQNNQIEKKSEPLKIRAAPHLKHLLLNISIFLRSKRTFDTQTRLIEIIKIFFRVWFERVRECSVLERKTESCVNHN